MTIESVDSENWEDDTAWMEPAHPDRLKNYRVTITEHMDTSDGAEYAGYVGDCTNKGEVIEFWNEGNGGADMWHGPTAMLDQFEADAKAAYAGTDVTFDIMDIAALWITERDVKE